MRACAVGGSDLIEQAIEILNTSPEQLYIEAKFAEIEFNDGESLGFDWYLGKSTLWVIRSSAVPDRIRPSLESLQTTIRVAIFHIRALQGNQFVPSQYSRTEP